MDDTDYALGRTSDEYRRLIEQAELLRPLTERMLLAAGIRAGMRVLDIGCGVGDVSFLLSTLVGPKGSVVGVDIDGDALKVAEERRIAKRITNVEFRQGDARTVESEKLFDAAVGRLVLMYMRHLSEALREIAGRVRGGGIIAFHEWVGRASTTACAATHPVLARVLGLIARTFESSGAHLEIGAELYRHMLDADLEPEPRPIAETAVQMGSGEVAYRRWSLLLKSLLPRMIKYGLATEAEILETDERLREEMLASRDLTPLMWLMVGQWARKPQ